MYCAVLSKAAAFVFVYIRCSPCVLAYLLDVLTMIALAAAASGAASSQPHTALQHACCAMLWLAALHVMFTSHPCLYFFVCICSRSWWARLCAAARCAGSTVTTLSQHSAALCHVLLCCSASAQRALLTMPAVFLFCTCSRSQLGRWFAAARCAGRSACR
jgi:hypothetical protein